MNKGDKVQMRRVDAALRDFIAQLRMALQHEPPDVKSALEALDLFEKAAWPDDDEGENADV